MLTNLVNNFKTKHLLLSYNNEGIMDIEEIKKLLLKNGKVTLYKKVYKKFKSNTKQEDENVFELLFHCEKGKETKKIKEVIVE
jgi:adenine-specific DNA-methyltransferase